MIKDILWFSEIDENNIAEAGGKGMNLGIMSHLDLPIPDGFVVNAKSFGEFLTVTNLNIKIKELLANLDALNTEELQRIAEEIQELIKAAKMPDRIKQEIINAYELLCSKDTKSADALISPEDIFVAVRSSATAEDLPNASFAGQQASFLNVKGAADVVQKVQECWASLFTARAIYYRQEQGFDNEKVLIAAVVQKMVNSDFSGIMFTVNPATNNASEIVIEAVFGLGEAIVSGSVTPDTYIVNKEDRSIKTHEIKHQKWGYFRNPETGKTIKKDVPEEEGKNQTIDDKKIQELARLGKKIEAHYHGPQDIEWAIEGHDIFIVQARAVTTFKPETTTTEIKITGTDNQESENQETRFQDSGNKKELKEELEELETEERDHGEELCQGDVASQGLVAGSVKIIIDMHDLKKITKEDILVTSMTTPDMVPAMQVARGIVTDEGGLTCHAAIVSREMGVPCVVGTGNATEKLKEGEIITVDAYHGKVYAGNLHSDLKEKHTISGNIAKAEDLPSTNTDVKVILGVASRAEEAVATGADGVGLLRLEFIIAQGGVHPAEYLRRGDFTDYINLLVEHIGKIAKTFGDKPVWVRSSDLRSDEYRGLIGGDQEPKESDPMIGWHGIRRLLDNVAILRAEFQAIKRLYDNGVRNVGIMIPFVIRAEELKKAKEIFEDETGLKPCVDIEFGVMIETPAASAIIEEICKVGISFASFGTNDLTQLTLGIDRNNERISKLFDEMHPAVLNQIADVIAVCKEYGVKTSICGQAGSREEMARFLVEHGIDSISANVDSVAKIRKVVAKVERNE